MRGQVVVMGVSGSGKTTLGAALAGRIGGRFVDSDDLHPDANIAKMSRGEPLTDADRWPWLERVAASLAEGRPGAPVVVACSALRRPYRQFLRDRTSPDLVFLYLAATKSVVAARLGTRRDHFMPPALLESQYAALEEPGADEPVIRLAADRAPDLILAEAVAALAR